MKASRMFAVSCTALLFSVHAVAGTATTISPVPQTPEVKPTETKPAESKPAVKLAPLPTDPDGPAKVANFIAAARAAMVLGEPMKKDLDAKAKTESTATAGLANAIGDAAKAGAKEGAGSDAAAVEAASTKLIAAIREMLAMKEKGLTAIVTAAKDTANKDVAEFLGRAEARVYTTLCMTELRTAAAKNGTYVGMYDGLRRYDLERIGDAMLDVFKNPSQTVNNRKYAGEALAQLGTPRHSAALKALYADAATKSDAKMPIATVLARLGDRGPLEIEVKPYLETLAGATADMKKVQEEFKTATDEQKKELGKRANEALGKMVGIHSALAQFYQEAQARPECAQHYEQLLELTKGLKSNPQIAQNIGVWYYNLACIYSLDGKTDPALDRLEKSFQNGYRNAAWAREDGDIKNIRGDPRFEEIMKKYASPDGAKPTTPEKRPDGS